MTTRNKIINISLTLTLIALAAFIYVSNVNNSAPVSERIELITFDHMKDVSVASMQEQGKLYDFTDLIIFYPDRSEGRYEALVEIMNKEEFGVDQVLFHGNGVDFNVFISELVFLKKRSDVGILDAIGNFFNGSVDAVEGMVDGVVDILSQPYESAKGIVSAVSKIPSAAWDTLRGEYTIDDLRVFINAYRYNETINVAKNYGIDYEKCYIKKTQSELDDITDQIISGNVITNVVALLLPVGAAANASKVKNVSKSRAALSAMTLSKSIGVSQTLSMQSVSYINDFKIRLYKLKQKHESNNSADKKRTRITNKESEIYILAGVGELSTIQVKGHKVSTRRKDNIDPMKKDSDALTNCERMNKGKPPIDEDGSPMQLHHHKQEDAWMDDASPSGYLVELSHDEHTKYYSDLHPSHRSPKSQEEESKHNRLRSGYWNQRGKELCI